MAASAHGHVPEGGIGVQSRLRNRVVLLFLVISLVPLVTVTGLAWYQAHQSIHNNVTERLWATAVGRTHRVASFLEDGLRDVETVSREPGIARLTRELKAALDAGGFESPQYRTAEAPLQAYLASFAEVQGYADLLLMAEDGSVVFSMNRREILRTGIARDSALARSFTLVTERQEPQVSDFDSYPPDTRQVAFMVAPVLQGKLPAGAAVLEIDGRRLNRMVQDFTGLGETGETVVGTRVDKEILFVAPTRHDPTATLKRRLALDSPLGFPLQQACLGNTGSGVHLDYRGHEVMAVWRHVPHYRWGVLVKIDTSEAYAPLRQIGAMFLRGAALATIVVIVAAMLLARSIVEPIRGLTTTARGLARGNLSLRAEVSSRDEIGELAETLNAMATRVEERTEELARLNAELVRHQEHLEEMVEARTTELRNANLELGSARDEAEAASRAKSAFLANMTHELRTPLNAVLGFSEILVEEAATLEPENVKSLAEQVYRGGRNLLTLVDDVLALTRLDSGLDCLVLDEVHVRSLVTDIVARCRSLADANGNTIEVDVIDDRATDRIDAMKTSRALHCLLENACKFTSHGSIRVLVRHEPPDPTGWLVIRVIDSGIGMRPEVVARVTQPFTQADDSLTRRYGGLGLGLTIARRLCELMGGSLEVASVEHEGSTLTMRLPRPPQPG